VGGPSQNENLEQRSKERYSMASIVERTLNIFVSQKLKHILYDSFFFPPYHLAW
jgi:hypothetical protein